METPVLKKTISEPNAEPNSQRATHAHGGHTWQTFAKRVDPTQAENTNPAKRKNQSDFP
jgi:hypothetical protein